MTYKAQFLDYPQPHTINFSKLKMTPKKQIVATALLLALTLSSPSFAKTNNDEGLIKRYYSKLFKKNSKTEPTLEETIVQKVVEPNKNLSPKPNQSSSLGTQKKSELQCNCIKLEDVRTIVAEELAKANRPIFDFKKFDFEKIEYRGKHMIGFDLIRTRFSYIEKVRISNGQIFEYPGGSGKTFGIGFSYKYAFYFNDLFVAPGVFAEKLNLDGGYHSGTQGDRGSGRNEVRIKDRIGTKVDIGYDINKTFSPYLTVGYAMVGYASKGYGEGDDGVDFYPLYRTNNGHASTMLKGAGIRINLTKDFSLNAEYNRQKFIAKSGLRQQDGVTLVNKNFLQMKLDIVKIGLIYNF
jgi:opacity protein-like surface antigen